MSTSNSDDLGKPLAGWRLLIYVRILRLLRMFRILKLTAQGGKQES